MNKKILIIEFCNYEDYPIGGSFSFAKNMMSVFGEDLVLVGITTEKKDPVGKWFIKKINGINYNFLALARYNKTVTKNFLPDRLAMYWLVKYYKRQILQFDALNVFVQRHEVLLAIQKFGFKNICYRSPGLGNPLEISKYKYARYFANMFENYFFSCLRNVGLILAAGDDTAIDGMIRRSKGKINRSSFVKFPTRVDTDIFRPMDKKTVRMMLNIPEEAFVISNTGRLAWFKGWKFMIDCFSVFKEDHPNSLFYLIGEGEDNEKIKDYIDSKGLHSDVILAGKKEKKEIALYLNASDLFIMGSYKEGWSTTLLEALACGVPICTTNFSSAKDIVTEGVTGFVGDHDVKTFVDKMKQTMHINRKSLPSYSEINKYAISELKTDILKHWELL